MLDEYDDGGSPSTTYIQDLFPNPEDIAPTVLEWAMVGWEGEDSSADKGDGSDTEDGHTLVRVTTHAGAPPTEPTSPTGGANGRQLLALPPMWPQWIPPKGTRCVLGYPDGPTGLPVILAYYAPAPDKQHGKTTAKLDFGDQNLVIKAASITLRDSGGNIIALSPDMGVQVTDDSGSGLQSYDGSVMLSVVGTDSQRKTWLSLTDSVATLANAAKSTGVVCGASVDINSAQSIAVSAMGAVLLGYDDHTQPVLPPLVGPTPGIPSKRVFIAG